MNKINARSRGYIIITLLITAFLTACGSSGGGNTVELTNVSGTVVDVNGRPVKGAVVLITSNPVQETTDENGEFSAEIEEGEHLITITVGSVEIYSGSFTSSPGVHLSFGVIEASFAIAFEITVGGDHEDAGNEVIQTVEGDYVIIGRTKPGSDSKNNVYLIKINAKGEVMWDKDYGGLKGDVGNSIYQAIDGSFIIAGWTESVDNGQQVYLIKIDANGEKDWEETYGAIDSEEGMSVQQTSEGGYVVVGSTWSFGKGQDIYLIKTDKDGKLLWDGHYGGIYLEAGKSVQQTTDGGYIIAGHSLSIEGDTDVYLVRTDPQGNELWTKTFGGQMNDYGDSVRQTSDGGFIITGRSPRTDPIDNDVYLIKTDEAGEKVWENYFGGINNDHGYSVRQTTDGGYIIAGDFNNESAYLIKTDAGGNKVWEKIFNGSIKNIGLSVCQTKDGGYIMTGRTNVGGDDDENDDVLIIKTDASGDT